MSLILRGLLVLATAASTTFPVQPPTQVGTDATVGRSRGRVAAPAPAPTVPAKYAFLPSDKEAYLDADQLAWIRPGFKIRVNSITIGADRRPVVDFNITDDLDQPLDREGKLTPGTASPSFILAWYNPETRLYTAYTTRTQTAPATSPRPGATAVQASADSGGTFTMLEMGHYTYKFRTVLPENYDKSKTHTLGVYGTRNTTETLGKNYYFDLEHDFRPDGAAVTETWDKIRDASCARCHDPLQAHGGPRRDVKICALCHTPQTIDPDTGETQDMRVLAHKIHMGHNLPSVQAGKPYIIIGNANSVHDYSHVTYPQDIRNCETCHEGEGTNQKPTQSDVWYTKPGIDACQSCHDDVDVRTGKNHPPIPDATDAICATCHVPDAGHEFDISIKGAHVIPEESKQLKGLKAEVVSMTNFAAGQKPVVVYKLTNGDGTAVDGSKLTTFAPMIAGPTTSYTKYIRESGQNTPRAVFNATTGLTTYTFNAAIPADAKGTWGVTADVYRNATLKRFDGGADITLREAAMNPVKYVTLAGSSPINPRRTAVSLDKCNNCHERLAVHGGQRMVIEECVMCHNPLETDVSRRPAADLPAQSVSMQLMIHRIHRGHNLANDYTVYGFGGTKYTFNEVTYPGDLRNCNACHVNNTHLLPVQGGDPVVSPRDPLPLQGPGTAACLGCHDNDDAFAHAMLNTTTFPNGRLGEACTTCHGAGREWGVDRVHAR